MGQEAKFFKIFPRWWLNKKSIATHQASWVVIGLVILLSFYGQLTLRRSRAWVSHTFEVLDTIQQVETELINAQSSLQTFLASQELANLTDYQRQVDAAQQSLGALQSLTVDNSAQQSNLKRLQELLSQQLGVQKKLLREIQQNSRNRGGVALVNEQLLYTNSIQTQLTIIQGVERKLLQQRRETLDQQGLLASGLMIVGLAVAVLLSWYASQNQRKQQQAEAELNRRLQAIELEQNLSSHLLTCRTFEEAHDILQSFLTYLLPDCTGAIYEISNSRDQMVPTVRFGDILWTAGCSPRECWALRRGKVQLGGQVGFRIPCKLCKVLHPDGVPTGMICVPLQAHEQTIGILHLTPVPLSERSMVTTLAHQVSLPLAVLHLQAELEYLSFHDANTGIYNRRFLDEMLERAIASAARQNYRLPEGGEAHTVGVIFMDVDHFKRFNSEYGHEMGDTVLRILGSFLTEITRAREDVPCRYGGEEFVLVMPGASEQATLAKAQLIRQGIKLRPTPTGATITLSLGVAIYPKHGSSGSEVLKAANVALLRAKAEGRDRVLTPD